MPETAILVIAREGEKDRYRAYLDTCSEFRFSIADNRTDALTQIADKRQAADIVVLDNQLDGAFELIGDLRRTNPRLMIVLIDEEADFAMSGQADDISTDPFTNDDLARRINRLISDRQLETLRKDSMPPVREFAKKLRKAAGEYGKQEATVSACRELGYDYVAFYRLESLDPLIISLRAQDGTDFLRSVAPKTATDRDIMGWVAQTGQSRIAGPDDEITHPLVRRRRLGAVACTPVGMAIRYGVLVACREQAEVITPQEVMLLELVSAQLAAVISKE